VTEDNIAEDAYPDRGDVRVKGWRGALLDVVTDSGNVEIKMADDTLSAPLCGAAANQACDEYVDPDTMEAAAWSLDCGCTEERGTWFPCRHHMSAHALARLHHTDCDCPRCTSDAVIVAGWMGEGRKVKPSAHEVGERRPDAAHSRVVPGSLSVSVPRTQSRAEQDEPGPSSSTLFLARRRQQVSDGRGITPLLQVEPNDSRAIGDPYA